jgi:hypothetical protein
MGMQSMLETNQTFPSPAAITANLIWALDCANTTSYPGSGTAWNDLTSGARNATLTNGPTFSTTNNSAITFNGTTQYAITATIPSTAITSISIQAWAYIPSVPFKGCIFKTGNNAGGIAIGVGSNTTFMDGTGLYILGLFPAIRWLLGTAVLTTGWHLFTMTLSATSVAQLYYDTTAITTPTGANPVAPTTNLSIAQCTGDLGTGRYFGGSVGAAYMYSSTLSQADVTANYNALARRYGLIA